MQKFKVLTIANKWLKYTDDEKERVLTEIFEDQYIARLILPIFRGRTFSLDKILMPRCDPNVLLNTLTSYIKEPIIIHASAKATTSTVAIHIYEPTPMYFDDPNTLYKTSGQINVIGYEYRGEYLRSLGELFHRCKFSFARRDTIEPYEKIEHSVFDGHAENLVFRIQPRPPATPSDKYEGYTAIPIDHDSIERTLVYDDDQYNINLSYTSNAKMFNNVATLFANNIFYGDTNRDEHILLVEGIRPYTRTEGMAIISAMYIKIQYGGVKINTRNQMYIDFRRDMKPGKNYIISYLTYVFKSVFPDEYAAEEAHIEDNIRTIYRNFSRPRETEDVVTEYIITKHDVNAINEIVRRKANNFEPHHITSSAAYSRHKTSRLYRDSSADHTEIHGPVGGGGGQFTQQEKEPELVVDYTDIFKSKIPTLIDKLSTFLDDQSVKFLSSKMQNIGFMKREFADDTTKDIKKYRGFQNEIISTMYKEWRVFAGTNDGSIDAMIKFVMTKETAMKLNDFLVNQINLYSYYDVSQLSVEKEKIRNREQREYRVNVYYKLTLEEKLEIDRYTPFTEEWNAIIDAIGEKDKYQSEEIQLVYVDVFDRSESGNEPPPTDE